MTTLIRPRGPMLEPGVTVLVRPSGAVQLGWDPGRALVLETPDQATDTVLSFLRLLDGLRTRPQIIWQARALGLGADAALVLLAELDAAGLIAQPEDRVRRVGLVHVHGRGPLSDALVTGVRRLGPRPTRSREFHPDATGTIYQADLVILADALVPEPQLVSQLVLHRVPHLQVRIRDGKGIVGPLVLPGSTSCLRCADLLRTQYDADWPHLSAQLLGRVGQATPATTATTAALTLGELEIIVRCSTRRTPATLNATLEWDPGSHRIDRRPWPAHPACGCRDHNEQDIDVMNNTYQ